MATTVQTSIKYGILKQNTRLKQAIVATELTPDTTELKIFSAAAGTLVKVTHSATESKSNNDAKIINVQLQVYDAIRRELCADCYYLCPVENILPVHDNIWPFMLSIAEPHRRLSLIQDEERRNWLMNVNLNDFVNVSSKFITTNQSEEMHYDGLVCYIGPVPELHAVGYFFGIELLNTLNSPQRDDIPFSRNYFECDAAEAIFTTADWVSPKPIPEEAANQNDTANTNNWLLTSVVRAVQSMVSPLFGN